MKKLPKSLKKKGYLLILILSAGIIGYSIILQTENLELVLTNFNRLRIFLFYTFSCFVLYFVYRRLEDKIVDSKKNKFINLNFSRALFFFFVSTIIYLRVTNGLTVLIDLQTFLLIIFFRVFLFVINSEKIRLKQVKSYSKYLPTFFLWFLTVYLFILFRGGGNYNNLIWESTDARHYKWLADQFSLTLSEKSYFAVGLPLLLVPLNVLAGTYNTRDFSSLINMNHFWVFFTTFFIWPISLVFLQKAALKILEVRETIYSHGKLSFVIILVNLIYLYSAPPYSSAFDKSTHPVMILGLIPAVEMANMFFINFAIYALVFYKKIPHFFVGLVSGLAVISKITNIIPVGMFYLFFFLLRGNKTKASKSVLIFLLVFSIQLIYAKVQFGGGIYPGRAYQSQRLINSSEKWISYTKEIYGLNLDKVNLVDLRYAPHNISLTLSHYWLPLLIVFLCFIYLVKFRANYLNLWLFSLGTIVSFWLFHTTFIRLGATYRYYHLLITPFLILVLPILYTPYTKRVGKFRKT